MARREIWRERIEQVKRMRQWVLDTEHILNGSWAEIPEQGKNDKEISSKKNLTNKEVGLRFDKFLQELGQKFKEEEMDQIEHKCLEEFLRVLTNLRPYLIQCYDLANFPRTNNEMESAILRVKARYRRISGRKHWNVYLLRHGRNVAFYEWWDAEPERWQQFEMLAQKTDRDYWKQIKKETVAARDDQLQRFRFLHKRKEFLSMLEDQWATASETATVH